MVSLGSEPNLGPEGELFIFHAPAISSMQGTKHLCLRWLSGIVTIRNMTTVVLKDIKRREFLFYNEFEKSEAPFCIAMDAATSYFDQHFAAFADESPKRFALFFKNPEIPAARVDLKLIVGESKITRSVIGDSRWDMTETSPYDLEQQIPRDIEVKIFPKFLFGFSLGPPGVKNIGDLIRRMDKHHR
jgi:hypothetical protein